MLLLVVFLSQQQRNKLEPSVPKKFTGMSLISNSDKDLSFIEFHLFLLAKGMNVKYVHSSRVPCSYQNMRIITGILQFGANRNLNL